MRGRCRANQITQSGPVVIAAPGLVLAGLLALRGGRPAVQAARGHPGNTRRPEIETAFLTQLADARIDTAKLKLEQNRPDEALALLVSALKGDPTSEEARALAETILSETTWNFPELTLKHPMPVDQIASAAPSSLWVSLGGKNNTTVRWNLDTPANRERPVSHRRRRRRAAWFSTRPTGPWSSSANQ